jgi:hypothetical protein
MNNFGELFNEAGNNGKRLTIILSFHGSNALLSLKENIGPVFGQLFGACPSKAAVCGIVKGGEVIRCITPMETVLRR